MDIRKTTVSMKNIIECYVKHSDTRSPTPAVSVSSNSLLSTEAIRGFLTCYNSPLTGKLDPLGEICFWWLYTCFLFCYCFCLPHLSILYCPRVLYAIDDNIVLFHFSPHSRFSRYFFINTLRVWLLLQMTSNIRYGDRRF